LPPAGAVNLGDFQPPKTNRTYLNVFWKTAGNGAILTASGMLPFGKHVDIAGCSDGTSNTMIVAEQSDWLRHMNRSFSTKYHGDPGYYNSSWVGGWLSGTTSFINNFESTNHNTWRPWAHNITSVRFKPNLKQVMGGSGQPGSAGGFGANGRGCEERSGRQCNGHNNPLQSPHPGGFLTGMTDGSVQFITGTTELAVLLRLAIRDDGQNVEL